MPNEQQDSADALCLRCGADANWRFTDAEKQVVHVICPDCGPFEVPRAEFEDAEFDIAQPEDRHE